jgi:hypothetical protein
MAMQDRIYTVSFQALAVTASIDFIEIVPADDKPVTILGVFLGQSTDYGDAQAEGLRWSIQRGFATTGSGGTAVTPRPVDRGDGTAFFTATYNNTTKAANGAGGTGVVMHADVFNVQAGLGFWWTPETQISMSQLDTRSVLRLESTPADSITFDGTLYVGEIG